MVASAEYEAGTPTTRLAAHFDLSKGAVLELLHEAGVSMHRQPLTDQERSDARRLHETGLSLVAVGERAQVRCATAEALQC